LKARTFTIFGKSKNAQKAAILLWFFKAGSSALKEIEI
jgi:hypothetical protein